MFPLVRNSYKSADFRQILQFAFALSPPHSRPYTCELKLTLESIILGEVGHTPAHLTY